MDRAVREHGSRRLDVSVQLDFVPRLRRPGFELEHRQDAVVFRREDRNRRPWLYNRGDAPPEADGG